MAKLPEHVKKARDIGNDSYDLINFNELPEDASAEQQVEALKRDQRWQTDHLIEISAHIDKLIRDIQGY